MQTRNIRIQAYPRTLLGILSSVVVFSMSIACDDNGAALDDTETQGTNDIGVEDIEVAVHDQVKTLLVVSWSQNEPLDEVWVRYTFENDEWLNTPAMPGTKGNHRQVVLGIPEQTEVTMQLTGKNGDDDLASEEFTGTTGAIPSDMPRPTVESFDESLASQNRYLFGSVDDTTDADEHYFGPFWLYIIDRAGRIVWYYTDLGNNPIIGFPRISRDGRFIFFGNRTPWAMKDPKSFRPWVVKMTLDHAYYEKIEIPLSDNVDMTDDGSLLYDTRLDNFDDQIWLMERLKDGSDRAIWNCTEVYDLISCYSNTVNWNPLDDTVLLSFPISNSVVEIDRETGDVVRKYGDAPGSYTFESDLWGFEFQHYANITPQGTLMVSSRIPDVDDKHAFMEFEIDRENEVLKEKWIYREGDDWAEVMGEAHPVPGSGGNVLANYGSGGIIKEITVSKHTAWQVKWDAPFEDDRTNKLVGHCTLFDDIYALNQGPEEN